MVLRQARDPNMSVKEEIIEDVWGECKIEDEFQDRKDCVSEDPFNHELIIKIEYKDDFFDEYVKEEPIGDVQVSESRPFEPDTKHELVEEEATTTSNSDNKYPNERMAMNHGEVTFACSFCNFRSSNNIKLNLHMLMHTKPQVCQICNYQAPNKSKLKWHMLTHTVEKRYRCEICGYKTNLMPHLKSHMLTHSGEKPYFCCFCDYRATRRKTMENHILTHTGEKPYSCCFCDYIATRKQALENHMLTHSGEKLYSCNVCDYKASQKKNLKNHMLTHYAEKTYSCNVCDYSSVWKANLKKHIMLMHLRKNPYSCNACDYSATRKKRLENHIMLKHSQEKLYSCNACDYRTKNLHLFKVHCTSIHNERLVLSRDVREANLKNHDDFQSAGKKRLHGHYLNMHNAESIQNLPNDFRRNVGTALATEIILNRTDKKSDDSVCLPGGFKKAPKYVVFASSSADSSSETLQGTGSVYPGHLSDHNYCLGPQREMISKA